MYGNLIHLCCCCCCCRLCCSLYEQSGWPLKISRRRATLVQNKDDVTLVRIHFVSPSSCRVCKTQKIIYLECIPKTDLHVVVVVEWEGGVRSALPEVAIKWETICCWETRFPATPPLLVPNKCEIKYWRWGPTLTVQKQTMSKKDEIYIDFPNSHSECWGASEVRNTQRQLLGLYLSVSNNKIRLIRFILRRITRRGK